MNLKNDMNDPVTTSRNSLLSAILWGGTIAGVLDAADAVVAFNLKFGLNPVQVLQFITSAALGPKAFEGGLVTAGLGMVFHFFIAFVVAAVFAVAARSWPILARSWAVAGLAYGASVYFVMSYLVLPLTAIAPGTFSLDLFLNGVVGHAVFVGLPIAWATARSHPGKN